MPKSAVDLLIADHQEAKMLFEKVSDPEHPEREEAWPKLAKALKIHITIEKELFYPRVIEKLGDELPDEIVQDQHSEETDVLETIDELVELGVDGEGFDEMFEELRDTVLEHAERVEEAELFPLVRQKMNARALEDLGREMEERQQRLKRAVEARAR